MENKYDFKNVWSTALQIFIKINNCIINSDDLEQDSHSPKPNCYRKSLNQWIKPRNAHASLKTHTWFSKHFLHVIIRDMMQYIIQAYKSNTINQFKLHHNSLM